MYAYSKIVDQNKGVLSRICVHISHIPNTCYLQSIPYLIIASNSFPAVRITFKISYKTHRMVFAPANHL